VFDEDVQALRQDFARDAEVALDLVEARHADPDISQDERRPRLTDDVQGSRDRARHVAEVGSLHDLSIVGCLRERTLVGSSHQFCKETNWGGMMNLHSGYEGSRP